MAKNIKIVRKSTVELPAISSYKLVVQAIEPEEMPSKIFIKQRIRNFAKETTDDIFVGVCTPTQLEDFDEDSPAEGTSFFRTASIELVARTPELIQQVFDSLVYEVKKLVIDLSDLEILSEEEVYSISALDPVVQVLPAPTIQGITATSTSLSVSFTAPTEIIGPPVRNYEYSLDGGSTWIARLPRSVASPLVIPRLTSNTTYSVQLRAVNSSFAQGKSTLVYPAKTSS